MDFYRFDKEVGLAINKYETRAAFFTKVLRSLEDMRLGFIQVEATGIVGYHQATVYQLFIVVEGKGWVTGEDRIRIEIEAGEGVFWQSGEWHESGSDEGMRALVIESTNIDRSLLVRSDR
ncbi:cupin domain-containing protein [Sutcliffiella rhizosphaerae]|uniref:Cupin type-2 domain-containing protein n=1 Tax=Sutcliffiella rhizosphaerae TaxID=2880967 RepID=A0ABM8YNU6_9BACI|nr:cupin domain-containing protein [Sutcliffiella rhizosphaerae]CAG9621567.1 hypothetical protein BACCIP111883_02340 [Sutcliffiella rhizosphaerae]